MSKEGAGEGARRGKQGALRLRAAAPAPAGSSALERRSTARCSRSVAWVLGGAVTPQTLQTQPVGAGAGRDLESLSSSCPSRGVHRHSLARGRTARITHLRGQAATLWPTASCLLTYMSFTALTGRVASLCKCLMKARLPARP